MVTQNKAFNDLKDSEKAKTEKKLRMLFRKILDHRMSRN